MFASNEKATLDAITLVDIVENTLLSNERRTDEYDNNENFPPRCYPEGGDYDTNMIVATFNKGMTVMLTIALHNDEEGKVMNYLQEKNFMEKLKKHYGTNVAIFLGGSNSSIAGFGSDLDGDDYLKSTRDLFEFKYRHDKIFVESANLSSVSLGQ